MNYQLKNVIEGVLGIGDIIDRAGIGASNYGDLTTRDLMRYELMQFLGYLGFLGGSSVYFGLSGFQPEPPGFSEICYGKRLVQHGFRAAGTGEPQAVCRGRSCHGRCS